MNPFPLEKPRGNRLFRGTFFFCYFTLGVQRKVAPHNTVFKKCETAGDKLTLTSIEPLLYYSLSPVNFHPET